MQSIRPAPHPVPPRSAFAGFRFPPGVIVLAVRWYLRFGLSYRDYPSVRRDSEAARRFFQRARSTTGVVPVEVIPAQRAPAIG